MEILKDNINKRNELKGKLDTLFSNMLELDTNRAELFINWCMDKSALYNKALLKKDTPNYQIILSVEIL